MYNTEDILARLQRGETSDDIALEMATALNAARDEYEAIQKEEAAKKAEEDKVMAAKREAMNDLLGALCNYMIAAGEQEIAEEMTASAQDQEKVDKLIVEIDSFVKMVTDIVKMAELYFPEVKSKEEGCGSAPKADKDEIKVEWDPSFLGFMSDWLS